MSDSHAPLSSLVSRVQGGGTPARSVIENWRGPIPWASVKDLSRRQFEISDTIEHISPKGLTSSAASLVPAGVPIVATRMAVGKTVIPNVDIAINQDLKALYPAANVDARYLTHALQFIKPRVDAVSVGSTVRGISVGQLMKFEVYSPQHSEQRRIATILDTLDDQIRVTEQIIAKLQLVRYGNLVDVFRYGIDESGTKRDPQHQPRQFEESPLGLIPRDWQVGPASKWCDRLTAGVVNSATHAYVHDGVPFIRSQNVKPNQIDTRDLIYVTDAFNRQQTKSILRADDVVIVRTGYPGTAAVVPPSLEGANCFSLVVASPNRDVLISEFMARYLNSPICARQINRLQFGSAQHNFNVGEMKVLPLPRPPIDEQARIVSVLRDQDSLNTANEKLLAKLKRIKHGLASDLLSGRIQPPMEEDS